MLTAHPSLPILILSALSLSLIDESLTVPMLVELMKKHKPFVQAACLGVMQNLSSITAFHRQLLERGVLEALDSSKDVDGGALGAQCGAVLYNFSFEEKSITKMMELGGIFLVTHLSYSNVIKVSHIFCDAIVHVPIPMVGALTAVFVYLLSPSQQEVLLIPS